ncbi:MAG: 4-hydroxy-3-methylbut-2-enyl diphosphate reductase [Flavobacteriaceae bacterium]
MADQMAGKPALKILLCSPRGFCAGVDRAIQIVELALKTYGPPIYVRHEIVHNRFVVEDLKRKGAVFVEELHQVPETDRPVIFSAHGVPKRVPEDAEKRNMFYLDATCPLVSKVHKEAMLLHRRGREIVLIGHSGHPEVEGTMGQLPKDAVRLVETAADAEAYEARDPENLAYITQTTLSVDDTAEMVDILKRRFPAIQAPHKEDICYATTNRQDAVKAVAPRADAVLVVGAPNSSNSQRLVEVAKRAGCPVASLIQRAGDIDWGDFGDIRTLGLTAGASAPEVLVEEVIGAFAERYEIDIETVSTAVETIAFNLPRPLREAMAAE